MPSAQPSDAELAAILDMALDAVIRMDSRDIITG